MPTLIQGLRKVIAEMDALDKFTEEYSKLYDDFLEALQDIAHKHAFETSAILMDGVCGAKSPNIQKLEMMADELIRSLMKAFGEWIPKLLRLVLLAVENNEDLTEENLFKRATEIHKDRKIDLEEIVVLLNNQAQPLHRQLSMVNSSHHHLEDLAKIRDLTPEKLMDDVIQTRHPLTGQKLDPDEK